MGAPEPITPPARDFNVRGHSCYDLEVTLVRFLQRIFKVPYRLDNPTLNLAQPEVVPFQFEGRAQTLELKVPPRVVRGRIPRTVTGEIAFDKLPDVPAIIVQCTEVRAAVDQTTVTVRILFSAYDEHPDGGGYQDVLNMTEAATIALVTFGQGALDQAYPIILPVEWKLLEPDTFPHYIAEMTTQWQLPSGRPMPDIPSGIIPAEHIEIGLEMREEWLHQ